MWGAPHTTHSSLRGWARAVLCATARRQAPARSSSTGVSGQRTGIGGGPADGRTGSTRRMRGAEAMAEADQLTRVATGRRDQLLTSVRPRERRAARGDGTEILLPWRAAGGVPTPVVLRSAQKRFRSVPGFGHRMRGSPHRSPGSHRTSQFACSCGGARAAETVCYIYRYYTGIGPFFD